MLDQDRLVLNELYLAWRSQKISVVTEDEFLRRVSQLGSSDEILDSMHRLIEGGYLARTPTSIYLTSRGMEFGLVESLGSSD